jgi:hypothetical protein
MANAAATLLFALRRRHGIHNEYDPVEGVKCALVFYSYESCGDF